MFTAHECQRAGEVILFAEEKDRAADDLAKLIVMALSNMSVEGAMTDHRTGWF
jgi:hypothetical protein